MISQFDRGTQHRNLKHYIWMHACSVRDEGTSKLS